jgi:hypothetical protein
MAINSKHKQYIKNIDNWINVDNVVDSDGVEQYLVYLNPLDTSDLNKARNNAYKGRAVFYALAGQTVQGMLGMAFSKAPSINIPPNLEYLKKNADGYGNSIYQQSQVVLKEIIKKSRCALYVSFPVVEGPISKADMVSGKYVANINQIDAKQVINWAHETVGSITKLSFVAIEDAEETTVEDYSVNETKIIRELFLEDGIYKECKHTMNDKGEWIAGEVRTPTDAAGKTWDYIPFTFIGASSNDSNVDPINLLPLVMLNIAHYRNSADFEDSVWFAGQAQPWMSGVTQEHINLMQKNCMYVGSRNLLAVPEDGQFGFASAPPNPAVRQAMLDKIDMMVGIGARMIQPGGVAKTAEQSHAEKEIQHSVLSLMVSNVNEAYTLCLSWCERYMGASASPDLEYAIDTSFMEHISDTAEMKEVIIGFLGGAVPMSDYIRYMKKRGIFDDETSVEDYAEKLNLVSGGAGGE